MQYISNKLYITKYVSGTREFFCKTTYRIQHRTICIKRSTLLFRKRPRVGGCYALLLPRKTRVVFSAAAAPCAAPRHKMRVAPCVCCYLFFLPLFYTRAAVVY